MSLISFLADNADVRQRFKKEFSKPEFRIEKELVAAPLTTRYSTVGTAFDYLLRFVVQRLNRSSKESGLWIAESALSFLGKPSLFNKGQKIVSRARKQLAAYLKSGYMSETLIESALALATLDPILRAGLGHEEIGEIHRDDVLDLRNLLAAVDGQTFTARKLCVLNPTFGCASVLVGGADADLLIDDAIIDIKTTKNLILDRRMLDQVIGYYVLHHIGGVEGLRLKPRITKVAIYFSRYGYLHEMSISKLINEKKFPAFVRWFKQRAARAFPSERRVTF